MTIFMCTFEIDILKFQFILSFFSGLDFVFKKLNYGAPYFKDPLTAAAMVRREQITLKLHVWQTIAEKSRILR